MGTSAGALALLSTEPGQIEALWRGLQLHQAETTRDQARALYRQLTREAAAEARRNGPAADGEGTVRRIFSVLFGHGDPARSDSEPLPKA